MNLANLLLFAPTLIVLFLVYHLIFKKDLPSQGILKILSYFLGILIISIAASWLVITYLSSWVDEMLLSSQNSPHLRSVINTSSDIIKDSFSGETTFPLPTPVALPPAEPINENPGNGDGSSIQPPTDGKPPVILEDGAKTPQQRNGPVNYTVKSGDTLNAIARNYGVTVEALRAANNLYYTDMIYIEQVLVIPAQQR